MRYLIDGYNLLFRTSKEGVSLEQQRNALITFLAKTMKGEATLVFDAPFQLGESKRTHYKTLEIVYTSEGQSADEYILEFVEKAAKPQEIVVVTSDKHLSRHARMLRAQTETIEAYFSRIQKQKVLKRKSLARPKKTNQKEATAAPSHEIAATDEACFDYYLRIFEKQFENLASSPCHNVSRQKKGKVPKTTEIPSETHEARWLRIFGRTLNQEGD